MNYKRLYTLILCLFLVGPGLFAQDKIYFKQNKIEDWKVTDITSDYIKGSDDKNALITYSVSHRNILFIINGKGNFLVIPHLFDNKFKSGIYIKNYLQFVNNAYHHADQIITGNNVIITCNIESEKEKEIIYQKDNKLFSISREGVVMIILKDGTHKLLTSAEKASKVLM